MLRTSSNVKVIHAPHRHMYTLFLIYHSLRRKLMGHIETSVLLCTSEKCENRSCSSLFFVFTSTSWIEKDKIGGQLLREVTVDRVRVLEKHFL